MSERRIISNPALANGQPLIEETEVSVQQILTCAGSGMSPQEIVFTFPELTLADVSAAFRYAAGLLESAIEAPYIDPPSDGLPAGEAEGGLDLNKILVVDDTPIHLEFMKVVFEAGEFTLSLAASGEEAWEKAQAEAPFLILSDIRMPGMSGLGLCQKIKADPRTKNASVIFITNYGQDASLVSKALNMGADDFISRPLDKDELLARVRAVARLKRAELEAQRQARINARLFAQVQEFSRHLEQMVEERTAELNQEKKKVEAILTSMADGVLVLDDEDRVLTLNTAAQKMFGLDTFEPGVADVSLASPQLASSLWNAVRQLVHSPNTTDSISFDVADPAKPGGALSLQANSAGVHTESGQTIGTVIVLSDVTAIVEVERMKARFMAGVTHELKTPLSIIKLHTNNLAAYHDRLPEAKRNQLLISIRGQVNLLEQLIGDILELARFDASMNKIEPESTDILQIADQVITEVRPLAKEKGLTLNWDTPTSQLIIQGDPNKLDWLIGNLVDNAIKYTPAPGSIEVKVTSEQYNGQAQAVVQVSDTGIGIPPEEQTRIFERFYRVDPSHTIPGTGLGLSIVKEIVTAHDGQVSVRCPPEGGSIFTVTLPID
jgi:two-component system phosphate regulon sensor histidine kinase PhoR